MKRLILLSLPLLAAGCGQVAGLQPAPGHHLPIKPATSARTPTAEDLLARRTDAAPQRVDELMSKSQPRRADRFDLPPPDGGAAPASAGTAFPSSPPSTSTNTGSVSSDDPNSPRP